MALTGSQLPTLSSGLTSGFTVNYLNTTTYAPNKFGIDTFNFTPTQAILNAGYDFYNLPSVTLININVLKLALRKGYLVIPAKYQPSQAPYLNK